MVHTDTWMDIRTPRFRKVPGYAPHPGIHDLPRTLQFPTDRCVGHVYMHPWQMLPHRPATMDQAGWHYVGAAQGNITIPAFHEVLLHAIPTALDDGSALTQLHPFAIQSLTLWLPETHPPFQRVNHALAAWTHMQGIYDLAVHAGLDVHTIQHFHHLQYLALHNHPAFPRQSLLRLWQAAPLLDLSLLTQLTMLQLCNIPTTIISPRPCPRLQTVLLVYDATGLWDIPVETTPIAQYAPQLRACRLWYSGLDESHVLPLQACKDLEELDLAQYDPWAEMPGHIGRTGIEAVAQCRKLQRLSLADLTVETLEPLITLSALTHLHITCTARHHLFHELGQMSQLSTLSLVTINTNDTPVSATEMQALCGAKQLASVQLYGRFAADALRPLQQLHHMCELDISAITDAHMQALSTMTQLRRLRLVDSSVTAEGLHLLGRLTKLEVLDIAQSAISDQALAALGSLHQLRTLNLSYTSITGTGLHILPELIHLQELYGVGSLFHDQAIQYISACPSLRVLRLSYVGTNPQCFRGFKNLQALVELSIEGVPPEGLLFVQHLQELVALSIVQSTLTLADIAALSRLPKLAYLACSAVTFPDEAWQYIQELTHLHTLKLHDVAVNETQRRLIHSLPMLQTCILDGEDIYVPGRTLYGQ